MESWFVKLTHPTQPIALWLKATILIRRDGTAVAEAWAIVFDRAAGNVAVKQTVPLADAQFADDRLDCSVADLVMGEGLVRGTVASGEHRVSADLAFTPGDRPLLLFGDERRYAGRIPSSKLLSPHPDSRFTGWLEVDGRRYDVSDWRGMQGHNWGSQHAFRYAWGHVNQWDGGDDAVFEGVRARVRVGPVLTPPVTFLCVRVGGREFAFSGRAAGEGAFLGVRGWRFRARSGDALLTGEFDADPQDTVGLGYANPDGALTRCLNSKLAFGTVRLEEKGRVLLDATTHAAAFEVGTREPVDLPLSV